MYWFRRTFSKLNELFSGWANESFLLRDFEDRPLQPKDELTFIDFGPMNSNTLIAMLIDHTQFEEPITEIMEAESLKQDPIPITELVPNQIVACQWSEDESWYRALIKDINLEKKKVYRITSNN